MKKAAAGVMVKVVLSEVFIAPPAQEIKPSLLNCTLPEHAPSFACTVTVPGSMVALKSTAIRASVDISVAPSSGVTRSTVGGALKGSDDRLAQSLRLRPGVEEPALLHPACRCAVPGQPSLDAAPAVGVGRLAEAAGLLRRVEVTASLPQAVRSVFLEYPRPGTSITPLRLGRRNGCDLHRYRVFAGRNDVFFP